MSRILVIDDDSSVRTALLQMLKPAGHEVFLSASGNDGIERCRTTSMDLVIVDLFMPEKDGLETIIDLRKEFPKLAIIAISGGHFTSHSMLTAARQLGAASVLEKPFDADKFLAVIDERLRAELV